MGLGIRRSLEELARRWPMLRRLLIHVHLTPLSQRRHPFDRVYGVRTTGIVPLYLLRRGSSADAEMIIYAGCVPSTVRQVLAKIPNIAEFDFWDLGCGLGRALIIASEFGPKSITGMELNPDLVARAQVNAKIVMRRFGERTLITVVQGDASNPVIVGDKTVIFLYHPFGQRLIERLADRIVDQSRHGASVLVVYVNPVHGDVFDGNAKFQRWSSATIPYEKEELGQGFDAEENVVVWLLDATGLFPLQQDRAHQIETVILGHKVRLVATPPAGQIIEKTSCS